MNEDFVFEVHWFDKNSEQTRKFLLTFYPGDNSVEMFDPKNRKVFLKRIHCAGVESNDFYIGNSIVVFSRRLEIVDYGNEATKNRLSRSSESTLAVVRPEGISSLGVMLKDITSAGYTLGRARSVQLDSEKAREFLNSNRENEDFEDLVAKIISGPILALELKGDDVFNGWNSYLESSSDGLYSNVIRFSSKEQVAQDFDFFFESPSRPKTSALIRNSTCCVIQPHAIKGGCLAPIISDIQLQEGLKITAFETFHLKYSEAEEFYEIYKGISSDYSGMVKELSSGKCVALEISDPRGNLNENDTEIVSRLRNVVGPCDPKLAASLRPHSLRAKHGVSRHQNGVHCTDLPEDGVLEVEYFFHILQC